MRLAIVALALYLAGGEPRTRAQSVLVAVLGVVPHSFAHMLSAAGTGRIGKALVFTAGTSLLFGLPLYLLLRRFGLLAAIGTHWLIDVVRFVLAGGR